MMVPFEDKLRTLVERKHAADWSTCQRLQEEMEASLEPLIRCVLRRGVGVPELARWVRTTLPALGEHERTAPALARRLCANLVRQYEPVSHRAASPGDTVVMA